MGTSNRLADSSELNTNDVSVLSFSFSMDGS